MKTDKNEPNIEKGTANNIFIQQTLILLNVLNENRQSLDLLMAPTLQAKIRLMHSKHRFENISVLHASTELLHLTSPLM